MNPRKGRLLLAAAAVLAVALVLLAPSAQAAAPPPRFVGLVVTQSAEPGVWTVSESVIFAPRNGTPVEAGAWLDLWVPSGATVHSVTVDGNATAWFHENATALRVPLEGPLRSAAVRFTLREPALPPLMLPLRGEENAIEVRALPGHTPRAEGLHFAAVGAEVGGRAVWEARPRDVAPWTPLGLSVAAPAGPEPPMEWPFAVAAALLLAVIAMGYVAKRRELNQRSQAPMTVVEHLRELSSRLSIILVAVVFFIVLFFTFGIQSGEVRGVRVWYPAFSVAGSVGAQAFAFLAAHFIPPGVTLVVTGPADAILAQFEVTLLLAILAAIPIISYELGAFLAPALLEDERKFFLRVVPAIAGLFLLGSAFAFFVMIPFMLTTLYEYAGTLGAVPFITASGLISFTVWTTLLFGVAFELPVIMAALTSFGLVNARTYLAKWRHAVVIIFILAGIVTPDPTIVSQFLVAIPLLGLYLAGAFVAHGIERRRQRPV